MVYFQPLRSRQRRFKQEEGSITVFLALTLVLILSFLFSMLELSRVKGLQQQAKRKLQLEAESLFGAYNQELWENYGVLFLNVMDKEGRPDIGLLEQRFMEASYGAGKEKNFYQMMMRDAQIEEYALATDSQGAEFWRQACKTAKESIAKEGIEHLKQQITQGSQLGEQGGSLEQKWDDALSAEEQAEEIAKEEAEKEKQEEQQGENEPAKPNEEAGNGSGPTKPNEEEAGNGSGPGNENPPESQNLPENPMEYVSQLNTSSLLAMVLEDPSKLSNKAIDISTGLEKRKFACGNLPVKSRNTVDKLWFIQYLDRYFSCGTEEDSGSRALNYELEYCICGKGTDAENLEGAVKRLLLLREAGNFITIMKDTEKKMLAMEIALAVVGFTGIAPLIKALQTGILLGWSYIESIKDLRCLLAGGKVPLIKTPSEWKSDLFHIREEVSQKTEPSEEKGLSYREYLQILLFLTGEEELTYRAMDIVERNIRIISGNSRLQMDAMVSAVKVNAVYTSPSLFLHLVPIQKKTEGNYQFKETRIFAY